MALFNKNPNETAYVGGKKHQTDVIKNSGVGRTFNLATTGRRF